MFVHSKRLSTASHKPFAFYFILSYYKIYKRTEYFLINQNKEIDYFRNE